jgi:hypothetical protein
MKYFDITNDVNTKSLGLTGDFHMKFPDSTGRLNTNSFDIH